MHTLAASFILGYHGCDKAVAEKLLAGDDFIKSENSYDWLGTGIYFWETNPRRGLEFVSELAKTPRGSAKIQTLTVVGAVIELGLCLDLTSSAGIDQVRVAYQRLVQIHIAAKLPLPQNHSDGLRRTLDRAVIETLHDIRKNAGEPPIDTVKGIFIEGQPVYDTSGFYDKTHVQICVRNHERIKGVFRVPARFLS